MVPPSFRVIRRVAFQAPLSPPLHTRGSTIGVLELQRLTVGPRSFRNFLLVRLARLAPEASSSQTRGCEYKVQTPPL